MNQRRGKYNARRCQVDGITFDSGAEMRRYQELRLMLDAENDRITDLQAHPRFVLQPAFKRGNKTIQAIHYEADFQYLDSDGRQIVEDVKGHKTAVYKLKRKMLLYTYPDIDFREVAA